jgi:anti-sigma factor RsiW
MQCEEFEDRLNLVLDERGRPECDAELSLHAEACAECRHVAALYGALLDGFYALSAPRAPADMAARVLVDIGPRRSSARGTVVYAALATAACLLVAIGPLVRLLSPESNSLAQKSTNRETQPAPLAAKAASSSPLQQGHLPPLRTTAALNQRVLLGPAMHESLPLFASLPILAADPRGDLYGELAKETGSGLAAIVLYVPGIGGARGIIDAESSVVDPEPAWAVQVSEGLRPVTDSVADTLNLLLKALPVTELASRS